MWPLNFFSQQLSIHVEEHGDNVVKLLYLKGNCIQQLPYFGLM